MPLSDQEKRDWVQQLQRTMSLLVHASNCKDANCSSSLCSKVKNLLQHVATCKKKIAGSCSLCRCADFVVVGIAVGVHSLVSRVLRMPIVWAAGAMTSRIAAVCDGINI